MPAAPELQALLSRRLRLVEGGLVGPLSPVDPAAVTSGDLKGVPMLQGVTPQDTPESTPRGAQERSVSPRSTLSADAAAGGPAPIVKADSSPAVISGPGSALAKSPWPADEWGNAQQWKRACVWSSRARMCDAISKNNHAQMRPRTESDQLRLLNSELLSRVRADSEARALAAAEKEKAREAAAAEKEKTMATEERAAREAASRLEALARQHEGVLGELAARLAVESQKSENLVAQLEGLQQSREAEVARSSERMERLREECHEYQECNFTLSRANAELAEERCFIRDELIEQARSRATAQAPCGEPAPTEATPEAPQSPSVGSEGRLRAALTGRSVSTEELREAIASVDALMAEAKRELGARELRERRAAYEQLHAATEGDQEHPLVEAIALACRHSVDAEDIAKAEEKLKELRSLTEEQRSAQAAQKLLAEAKRKSFQLVKRGEARALRELLESSEASGSPSWKSWKDHSGRTLLAYAKEVRSAEVKECLERLLAPPLPLEKPKQARPPVGEPCPPEPQSPRMAPKQPPGLPPSTPGRQSRRYPTVPSAALEEATMPQPASAVPSTPTTAPLAASPLSPCAAAAALAASPHPEEDLEQVALRATAFRAVVKDDTAALGEVLERLPCAVWSVWHNKAGRDLITLAQERRAQGCYVMLARATGILQERKREAFEESETVWILTPGEVQPRHATVVEDTSSDADEVLVEFWDSDGPPVSVSHSVVLKAAH